MAHGDFAGMATEPSLAGEFGLYNDATDFFGHSNVVAGGAAFVAASVMVDSSDGHAQGFSDQLSDDINIAVNLFSSAVNALGGALPPRGSDADESDGGFDAPGGTSTTDTSSAAPSMTAPDTGGSGDEG